MRSLAIAIIATLIAAPGIAGEDDMLVIDDAIQAASDQLAADEPLDTTPLYGIVTDPVTLPACRNFADTALAAILLVEAGKAHPQSQALEVLFGYTIEAATVYRHDCLLAI